MSLAEIRLDDKYRLATGHLYLTGTQALTRLPMLQHQRDQARNLNTGCFISGYRGSPLGGLDKSLWEAREFLKQNAIHFQPGLNEELAATAVWGSQQTNLFPGAKYDGVFAMWYGKGPGVDRAGDVFKHANAAGVSPHGGVLLLAGDDHGCKSSTLPHQSEHAFIAASIPVLNPANVQEILDYGILGWELSRYSGCWVALKTIAENVDSSAVVEVDPLRVSVTIPDDFELPEDGVHIRWPDPPLAQEKRLNLYKIYAARAFARANNLNPIMLDSPNPRLGIITTGKSYLDVRQALDDLGLDEALCAQVGLRVLKVGMSWPLEPVSVHEFAQGLDEILVVEEKRSILEDQLTGQLYNWPVDKRPRVVGEFDEQGNSLLPNLSELTPAMIARVIAKRLAPIYTSDSIQARLAFLSAKEKALAAHSYTTVRTPHYCSGCPHNTSTKVPEGSRASAGIGCHYMVQWMDRRTETFTQMGGEGVNWIGQAPFTDTPHMFQNLGDGTYFHSGSLAVRAAVASGVNITFKILYNDAVAMTGGQPIDGELRVDQLSRQVADEGVKRIALVSDEPDKYPSRDGFAPITSFHHRRDLDAVQRELREFKGVSVIIYDQTCATEKRRRRKRGKLEDPAKRAFINPAVCEGCGDCGEKSNCLAVLPLETELGRKREIDQNACNKDFSCVEGFCPSFVTVHGGGLRKPEAVGASLDPAKLPEPQHPTLERPWNVLIPGVGGSGVTTLGALLGMAAHLEGKGCTVLDQAGLAQKFGPVVTHVRIAAKQDDIYAVRIAAGETDLLLGCDLVVAAGDDSLTRLNDQISHAVINSHEAATAEFTRNPDAQVPGKAMREALMDAVGAEKTHFIDATRLATRLMGDSIATNLFLLGFAYQQGLLPLSAEAIEKAITINGVAAELNLQAFRWGRRAALERETVEKLARPKELAEPICQTLEEIVDWRVDFLTRYQNAAYAKRYRDKVEQVRALDTADDLALSKAVARYYFKLLAYKDEYEVARLYSEPEFREQLEAQFEGDYKLQFHLAPAWLAKRDSATGEPRKRELGPWVLNAFGVLAKLKFLRGTPLDVFGYGHDRRVERELISEYERNLDGLLAQLKPSNYRTAVAIAALPELIRGYGPVKERSIAKARQQEKVLKEQLNRGDEVQSVRLFEPAA
ncbi:indolepyruvate ferredoxin oxidoreductase family protein [Pseudomonas sp. MTM4]|uniref:indolepyruvate ferredoxin oxidoreductase family protein n=1 Tax=unclassified Pseudomonas TaxID=196821 RepID=UPI0018D1F835|nr:MULTISPECIES: indolepyruvate ferredoxin oxidoreductase family protein [unclassified Pseudomonas]MBC8651331.1 indolepyruvate ferredoxin oxidoreductase family protein [Pseudomonas sp. MT4]QXY91858.1 indolepyruvate ferredoxin oxidoreductase family protein [Pseudomonas sp. MTM4]